MGGAEPGAAEVQAQTPTTSSAVETVQANFEHAPPPPPSVLEAEEPAETDPKQKATTTGVGGDVKAGKNVCASPCEGEVNSAFKAALRTRARLAQGCYMAALRQNEMLRGKLTIALRIGPNGRACSASVTDDSLGSAAVSACIKKRFMDATYPAPRGGCVDAAVPLNLVAK